MPGTRKCLEVLEPSGILLFGKDYPEIRPYGTMVVVENSNLVRKKTLSTKGEDEGVPILKAPESAEGRLLETNNAVVI